MTSVEEHNNILTKIMLRCHWITYFREKSFIAIFSRWAEFCY